MRWAGQLTLAAPLLPQPQGYSDVVGIRLRPGRGAEACSHPPIHELTNTVTPPPLGLIAFRGLAGRVSPTRWRGERGDPAARAPEEGLGAVLTRMVDPGAGRPPGARGGPARLGQPRPVELSRPGATGSA